jgi:carboxyl-terminal processing protease
MSDPFPSSGGGHPAPWPPTTPPPEGGTWQVEASQTVTPPSHERSRAPLWVALFVVAVLSGSALFVSGFTLGLQQSLAPGTSASDQQLLGDFWEAWHKINAEYVGSFDPHAVVEGAIGGMFGALHDPYSSYMTSQEYQDSLSGISGEIEGIGAQMSARGPDDQACDPLSTTCKLLVDRVIPDSPASKQGLLVGDQLVAVDGKTVDGSSVADIVDQVRGPKGSAVTLSILRGSNAQDLTLTRDIVPISEVDARLLANGSIGYLGIAGFSANAADEFRTRLQEQLASGVRKFVIDVRGDPGGFVDAAVSIASQFVGSGPIYWEQVADGSQRPTDAQPGGLATDPGIRVALLVNGNSASASEILAGALHDTGRATLVGETTFGKGTIQQWHLLGSGEGGGFRLSVAKWLTPNKTWVHGLGITPDVVVQESTAGAGRDPQLDRAIQVLDQPASIGPAPAPSSAPTPVGSRPASGDAPTGGTSVRIGIEVSIQLVG